MRLQTTADLDSIDLVQIIIGPDSPELTSPGIEYQRRG